MKIVDVRSVEQLRAAVTPGFRPEYLFFAGHQPDMPGGIDRSCLSENHVAQFELDGERFSTVEHYLAWRKAMLFGDTHSAQRILQAESPAKAKAIGRSVTPFDDETWKAERFEVAVAANVAKFTTHPRLGEYLAQTGQKVLACATPIDRVWGIGLSATDPQATDPQSWSGLNILGFSLMEARARLAN